MINFNEVEIESYVRTISEEEEQWLITPLHVRAASDIAISSATETSQDTPTSLAMELEEITQKSLEQYHTQQLLIPESS